MLLERFAAFLYRRRLLVLAVCFVLLVGGLSYAKGVYGSLSHGGFSVPSSQSAAADSLTNKYLGGNRDSLVILLSSSGDKATAPDFRAKVSKMLDWLDEQPSVSSISSYYSTGDGHLLSKDGRSTYLLVGLKGSEDKQAAAVKMLSPKLHSYPLHVKLGGAAAVNAESTAYVQKDLAAAERYTFPITGLLLLLIFGSITAAALPLALGAYGIVGALVITRLVAIGTNMSVYVINLISLLGLGLAIDYSLFIVSRFREELGKKRSNTAKALKRTLATAGKTVIFSGLTVMIALLGLTVFPISFLRSMGIGGAAAVGIALLGALVLLPTLLAVLGKRVNALKISSLLPTRARRAAGRGNWEKVARRVMRYPVLTVAATLAVLLLAGVPFLGIRFINPDYRVLPPSSESRQVGETLIKDFPVNTQAPIQVVVKTPGPPSSPANIALLDIYGTRLKHLPNVRSIQQPAAIKGTTPEDISVQLKALQNNPKAQAALAQYAEGNYVLINVVPEHGTYAPATEQLVRAIRQTHVPNGLNRWVGGQTADLVDLLDTIRHFTGYALAVVLGAMLVLFFLMLGSVVIPLKTMVLNILSLAAAFGALVWIFQQGHLAGLIGFTPVAGIDATQPVIIFALAFGLSMDYAIFLFSRIKEHYDEHGLTRQAVAWGLQRTGGIITSAALLLAVVVGAFAAGRLTIMKEVAIGLIVAILVDVFVVRMLLVPASMTLLGRYNWWAPGPLKKLHDRFGFKDTG